MARKTNPALIGAFVVGAVVLAVAAVVVFGGGNFLRQTQPIVAYFDGSLKGIAIGAPVTFNGVKVGSVTDFKVVVDAKASTIRTPVFFEIDADRLQEASGVAIKFQKGAPGLKILVERGLRAQLDGHSRVTGRVAAGLTIPADTPASHCHL